MAEIFRKGQLVPRRLLAIVAGHAKAQHNITFGCDVEVQGRKFTALSEGVLFYVKRATRRMNNGTYQEFPVVCKDVHWTSYRPPATLENAVHLVTP